MTQPALWPFPWLPPTQTTAADSLASETTQPSGGRSLPTQDEALARDEPPAKSPVQPEKNSTDVEAVKDPDDRPTQNARVQVEPIGYRSPPVAYQFPPLKSGNPRGRPRKSKSGNALKATEGRLLSIVRREAERKVKLSDRGKPITISTLEGIIRGGVIKSLQGNSREKKMFLELYKEAEREPRVNVIDLVGPNITNKEISLILDHPRIKKMIEERINQGLEWIFGLLTQEQHDELRNYLEAEIKRGDDGEGRIA